MLYRGQKPATLEERLDYEYECELNRLCDAGLLLRCTDAQGRPIWVKTLRGHQELGSPDPGAIVKDPSKRRRELDF